MLPFFFDNVVYKLYKNKWKLEEEEKLLEYTLPKNQKIQFNNGDPEELLLFKYPSHYRHFTFGQYNWAFASYFGSLAALTAGVGLRSYLKKGSWRTLLAMSVISFCCVQESLIGYRKVKDVKKVVLKKGKIVQIETFQDGDIKYEMDLKDLRVVSKSGNDLVIFIDVNHAKSSDFRFFFMEPSPGTVNNLSVFETVILDKRYLKY